MPEGAPVDLLRGLAVLAEPPAPEHSTIAGAMGLPSVPTPAEYSDLFLFQLYPYASVHLGEEGMIGGESRGNIAGFWRAVGHVPPAEPDHLSAMLGLYAALCDTASSGEGSGNGRTGGDDAGAAAVDSRETSENLWADEDLRADEDSREAEGSREAAESALRLEACRTLLAEHLAPWLFPYLTRVREIGPETYRAWAAMLETVLIEEVVRIGPPLDVVPALVRGVPETADPRLEGSDAFLKSLLAPARSGVLLTRADLALIARGADVGLRAGERRYALEHLLAQDAAPVLTQLGVEAARQAELHGARSSVIGPLATHFAVRARTTATLLDSLASDADVPAASGAG